MQTKLYYWDEFESESVISLEEVPEGETPDDNVATVELPEHLVELYWRARGEYQDASDRIAKLINAQGE